MGRMIRIDDEEVEVKEKTIINFVLDESGSMLSRKADVIKGFNEYVRSMKQEREEDRRILFTLTKFHSEMSVPHITVEYLAKDLDEVPLLTRDSYRPDGGTPLYDAIGETVIRLIKELQDEKEKPGVLFVIMTDGEENDSKGEFRDKSKITKIIQDKEAEGWTFVYLGADQNAWQQAGAIGLQMGNVRAFQSQAYGQTFSDLAIQTKAYYSRGSNYTRSFFSDDQTAKDSPPVVATDPLYTTSVGKDTKTKWTADGGDK